MGAAPFDVQRKAMEVSIATQDESAIRSLFEAGMAENKFSQAFSVSQGWFAQNMPRDPKTLLLAARVAEYSAHYPEAVAFYQQFLDKADVKSADSQAAVMSLYHLMMDVMKNQNNSAYYYMRTHAEGFMPHGSARQYNHRFLDKAKADRKWDDLADFLGAVCRTTSSRDEIAALYAPYFHTLLFETRTEARHGRGAVKFGRKLAALGESVTHDEELRLLLIFRGKWWNYGASIFAKVQPTPAAPLGSAHALLKKYPEYTALVWGDIYINSWYANHLLKLEKEAKIALIKKYLPKLKPIVRYQLLRSFHPYAKGLIKGKELKMLNAERLPRKADFKFMNSKTPEDERKKEYRKLIADFDSAKPKMPFVYDRLVTVLAYTPSVWAEHLKRPTPEREWIFFRALSEKSHYLPRSTLSTTGYAPINLSWNSKHHPGEPALRKLVDKQVARGKVQPWLALAWINGIKPTWVHYGKPHPEAHSVGETFHAMPGYNDMPFALRGGMHHMFRSIRSDGERVVLGQFDPKKVCEEVLALTKDSDSAAVVAALDAAISRMKAAPKPVARTGHAQLIALKDKVFADSIVLPRIMAFWNNPSVVAESWGDEGLMFKIYKAMQKKGFEALLQRHAAVLWKRALPSRYGGGINAMLKIPGSLLGANPSGAATVARAGRHVFAVWSRDPKREEGRRTALAGTLGRANQAMRLSVIAVDESSPDYPVYKSQNEFVAGNHDAAWKLFDENVEATLAIERKLSAGYMLWVLEKLIYQRDEELQQRVVTDLRTWRDESSSAFSKGQSVMLDISYGDIAVQRGMLRDAHRIYLAIRKNKHYEGVLEQHTATLRQIRVERITKNFDAALNTVNELIMQKVPEMWAMARYARAEIYYDMEDYDEVRDIVDGILLRDPSHQDAKILQGKVMVKTKDFMGGSELEIGSSAAQKTITPGEMLKVTLNDPSLAVSGGGTDIEVVVWADSGDSELVLLRQFGDSKTKFRGVVPVRLGKPNRDDKTLQVIGDDKVYFSYSERFRAQVGGMEEWKGGPLTIVSDATLMASARKLLTLAEQQAEDKRRLAEALKREGVSLAALDPIEREEVEAEMARDEERRLRNQRLKPGNQIYLRVVDEDRGRTAEVDELVVSISATSGDSLGRVVLKETGTHTGIFEATVRTATAQAMAFASSTRAGLNPNMVISPQRGHPAWRSAPGRPKGSATLTVDLNDNVSVKELTITAAEPGMKLRRFKLSTGLNRTNLTPVATIPHFALVPDPLRPSVFVVRQFGHRDRYDGAEHHPYDLAGITDFLSTTFVNAYGDLSWAANVRGISRAFPSEVIGKFKDAKRNWFVAGRFRANFYEKDDVTRRFRLELGKAPRNPFKRGKHLAPIVTIDSRQLKLDRNVYTGAFRLKRGVHRIEILVQGRLGAIGFGRSVKLTANLYDEDEFVECPDSMFDPSKFPAGVLAHANAPAKVTANEDGTEWKIRFAPGSRARVLNLEFHQHEGPEAALTRLALTSSGGKRVLPVEVDYTELTKNDTLEILTGDRVWVRYVDDRYVTKSRQKHERQLTVAFSNGRARFADIEPRLAPSGHINAYDEAIVRFRHDEKLSIVVDDPDMDVSDKPDEVTVTVGSKHGDKKTFTATETGDSSGTFRVFVTPVAGRATGRDQIRVRAGGALVVTYRDAENATPGIPFDRIASIPHAKFATPIFELSDATAERVEPAAAVPLQVGFEPFKDGDIPSPERVRATMRIRGGLVELFPGDNREVTLILGAVAVVNVVAPHLALRAHSKVTVFVQTDAGRKMVKRRRVEGVEEPEFDITVPGTRMLTVQTSITGLRHYRAPIFSVYGGAAYLFGLGPNSPPRDGSFTMAFPLTAGSLKDETPLRRDKVEQVLARCFRDSSVATEDKRAWNLGRAMKDAGLYGYPVAKPGDRVHFGLPYLDEQGRRQWLTASARVITHAQLDVLKEDQRSVCRIAGLGDRIHVRVLDLGRDTSDRADKLTVEVSSRSGARHSMTLRETDGHTGIFKGSFQLTIADEGDAATAAGSMRAAYDIRTMGFPAIYGDKLTVNYTDKQGREMSEHTFSVDLGADGTIKPFTKQYGDDEIATRTQFAMAEAYLEVAKRYRKLKNYREAEVGFRTAKQLLASTIERFNDAETRAHAEYLLGNLTYEEAGATRDTFLKEERYQAALARFQKVTSSYPDTSFASKAQFKKAVVYERLKEPDIAAQEYVKLAYRYPDSEHIAVALARLGVHFLRKASKAEKESKVLLKKTGDKDVLYKGDLLKQQAIKDYSKSARIFDRLLDRFPTHELASKAGLMSGKSFMRSNQTEKALVQFKVLVGQKAYDDLARAEAMYWSGKCFTKLNQQMAAYAIYMRCTDDFPETKWSSYCLSELSQPRFKKIDSRLELERLKEGL